MITYQRLSYIDIFVSFDGEGRELIINRVLSMPLVPPE